MKLDIINGSKYGNFEVLEELPRLRLPSGQTNRVFMCSCICGRLKKIRLGHLTRCKINSCGCLNIKKKFKTEEDKYIRKIWRAIKYRTCSNYHEKHLYFEKGVRVCDEWINNYDSFYKWAIDNNLKKGLQIDRIDSNGNYEPSNCRVVTPVVNCNNRENTFRVKYNNKESAFMMLIREKGLLDSAGTIRARIKRGWSIIDAINTPIRKGNYKRIESNI